MAAKPRPHTLARAADRSSVRTPPPPRPIPGKVRVTPARTGGPSHRYVVGKNKLWFANATRTPPPQTEPTRLERHRHHCFSRPYAGTETATKCRDRRGTISLDWNNCVQCISKLRGACGGCTRSSLVQKKCCALRKAQCHPPSAQCTLRTDGWLASGREKPILRRRRRPPQPRPGRRGSPPASCAAMWWHTPAPPLSSGLILSTMGCGSLQNGCDPLQGATDRAQGAAGRLQPHKPLRLQ